MTRQKKGGIKLQPQDFRQEGDIRHPRPPFGDESQLSSDLDTVSVTYHLVYVKVGHNWVTLDTVLIT